MMAGAYWVRMTDGAREVCRFRCRSDEPLIDGIRLAAGGEMPRGCSGGGCGVCKIIVRRGLVSAFKPMSREHITEEELSRNVALACCVYPRSDLDIRLFRGESEGKGSRGVYGGAGIRPAACRRANNRRATDRRAAERNADDLIAAGA
jgi:ferredoxin